MPGTPDEEERQIEALYASIGRIAVHSEHLNHSMSHCCAVLLRVRPEDGELVDTVLAGHNLENMRRVWVSMMKLRYRGDAAAGGMIDHLAKRIDSVAKRRNDTIHRLWFIGYRGEGDLSLEVAGSMKITRDIREKGDGGLRVSKRDSKDFEEIVSELISVTQLIYRFAICVGFDTPPSRAFSYENEMLVRTTAGA